MAFGFSSGVVARSRVVYEADTRNLESGARRAEKTVAGSSNRMGVSLRTVAVAGAAVAGGIGYAVKAAVDFESSFAGVRKTVNATEAEFQKLSKGLLDLSRRIPVNVNELNRIAESAGQLGIKKQNILAFTETIAKLGVTTNLTSEQAATSMARFANITRLPQVEIGRLGSTIVALGNNLATTESEIIDFGLRIAGAGKQVGLTEPQILALGGALSSVGISAEAGGTAISTAMITIDKAVERGGEKLQGFARIAGMSADQFAKAWRANPEQALLAFIEGLDRVKQSGQPVFGLLDELGLGGIRVRDALLRASGAGDLFRRSLELGTKAWKENIALNKEAEQRFKTTESQFILLKNNFQAVAIVIGTAILPALNAALLAVTRFARENWDTIERVARQIGSLVGAAFDLIRSTVEKTIAALRTVADLVGGWPTLFALVLTGALALKVGQLAAAIATNLVGSLVATQVAAANAGTSMTLMGAAGATAIKTIRAALVTTGIGALIVGLGVGAMLVITHWKQVEGYFRAFSKTMFEIGKLILAWFFKPFIVGLTGLINMIAEIVEKANRLPLIGKAIPDGLVKGLNAARSHVNDFVKALSPDFAGVVDAWRKGGEASGSAFAQAARTAIFTSFPGLGPNPLEPPARGPGGQATVSGQGAVFPVPRSASQGIIGVPGVGTHAQSDWQSRNAIDIKAKGGTPVFSPVDGVVTKVGAEQPAHSTASGKFIFGGSVTIRGAGIEYFITHLENITVKTGDPVSRGQVIGYVFSNVGTPHVHFAQSTGDPRGIQFGASGTLDASGKPTATSPATTAPSPPPTAATPTKTSTAKTPTATAKEIAFAAAEDVQQVARKVKFAYGRLDDIPVDAARRLRPKLADLARILSKPVTPETLAEVAKQAERYNAQLSRVLEGERIAEQWRRQRAELQRLLDLDVWPPAREQKIRQQIGVLDKQIAAVANAVVPKPGDLARAKAGLARLGDVADQGIETLRQRVQASRARFQQAWGTLTDIALKAFDEQTARLVAAVKVRIRSVVDGIEKAWEFGEGFKTPTEQILERESSARAQKAAAETKRRAIERVNDATAAVIAAQQEGGQAMLDAERELYEAQKALDEIVWEERRALLQEAAAEERRVAEQRLSDAQAVEQERRRLLRIEFEAELVELGSQIVTRKLTYTQAMNRLRDLFEEYEVPFAERGSALSAALGLGMQAAMGAVHDAIRELKHAVEDLVRAIGGKVSEAEGLARRARAARDLSTGFTSGRTPGGPGGVTGFAEGGEVHMPTLAVIGEGGPEIVLPVRKVPVWARPWLLPAMRAWIRRGSSGARSMFGLPAFAGGYIPPPRRPPRKPSGGWDDDQWGWPQDMWQPPPPTQSQLFAAAKYAIFREHGGDLFGSRAGALGPFVAPAGRPELGGMLRAIQQQITMVFQQNPADPFVYFERARHQARAYHRG